MQSPSRFGSRIAQLVVWPMSSTLFRIRKTQGLLMKLSSALCCINIQLFVSFIHLTTYFVFSFSLESSSSPFPIDTDWCELMTEIEGAPASPGCATNQWTNPMPVSRSLSSTCCWPTSWMDGLGVPTQYIWWSLREPVWSDNLSADGDRFYSNELCAVRNSIVGRVI